MPRIDAPTVAEHRANVQRKLVDAADEILRSGRPELLTAQAVTTSAGIARNSIYRYVDSVDDLRGLVLERYLPNWLDSVESALAGIEDPLELLEAWLAANLRASTVSGHGWLMSLGRSDQSAVTQAVMERAHGLMHRIPGQALQTLLPDPAQIPAAAGLIRGLLETGFRMIERGIDLDQVILVTQASARGMINELSAAN
ncbi:MAG: TetR family transcriptional regulator [Arachnia propionica]|nr:MAG: TetR family transcriptional regulator [Arachnia propionica]